MLNSIDKNSESWLGFRLFIFSIALMVLIPFVLTPLLYNLFFATLLEEIALATIVTLVGVSLAALVLRKKINLLNVRSNKVVQISTVWFLAFNVILWLFLFFGDQTSHYGVTSREELTTQIPLSLLTVLIYYVTASLILKKKVV